MSSNRNNRSARKKIMELYAGLEDISKMEDNPTDLNQLEKLNTIEQKFDNFFQSSNHRKLMRLYDNKTLEGAIKDKHRDKGPFDESRDDTEIKGDSLLLRAMSIPTEEGSTKKLMLDKITRSILRNCPQMMVFEKRTDKCDGITPLHVAILKEDKELLNYMATILHELNPTISEENQSPDATMIGQECYKANIISQEHIDNICATGPVFRNTAMMAGTLLGTAALKFNEHIFRLVYNNFTTKLDATNGNGDNIVHCIIKFANVKPDKKDDALKMLRFILNFDFARKENKKDLGGNYSVEKREYAKKNVRKLLMMKNGWKRSPLQEAAKTQQYDFFKIIMNHEVYHSKESSDGIQSEDAFDITEIETFALKKTKAAADEEDIKSESHESVLEYIVHHQTSNAFLFADFLPVKEVIKGKWKYYKVWFWWWFFIHSIFMSFLSVAALYRSEVSSENSDKFKHMVTKDIFVTFVSVLGLIYGVLNLLLEVARCKNKRFQYKTTRNSTTPYSNCVFRVFFIAFDFLLFVDFVVALIAGQSGSVPDYHNHCLIFAVILGWYLTMFFLQGFKVFSFFTVLIQTVIKDMLKFAIVMSIFLLAFSIAMFMIMQGASTEDDDFNHFGKAMVKMLTIMLGIGDLGILFQARQPILAVTVFILFVFFTTILLLNSLIAMMSNSCTDLMSSYRGIVATKMHCRIQKLSVILYLESFLPRRWCKEIGDKKIKRWYENNEWNFKAERRSWSLSSLHEEETEKEPEDSSDSFHTYHTLLTLLSQHTLKDKNKNKKSIENKNTMPGTVENMQQTVQQHTLDITHTDRKQCNNCKQNEVVESQTLQMTNVSM